jgi:hypothetical protein
MFHFFQQRRVLVLQINLNQPVLPRIMKYLPPGELVMHRLFVIVRSDLANNRVVYIFDLKKYFPPLILPSRAPCNLSYELKGSFISAFYVLRAHSFAVLNSFFAPSSDVNTIAT